MVRMRRITDDQRRHRLAVRHHLATGARASDVTTLAGDLVGLHGSDPATVFLSAAARLKKPAGAVAALERALYDDRTLVRTLCMRRTMFVVPLDLVARRPGGMHRPARARRAQASGADARGERHRRRR